jgi:outer membrane protein TolC
VTAGRSQAASAGGIGVERTQYGPSVTLSQLVLDFGGRNGTIEAARQTAIAADFTHNATVQNTILVVETAAFSYLATRALRDAQRSAIAEATANLAAAEERHRVGLATIADVLQARTARAQQALNLETLEGQLHVTRAGVAAAMGFPVTAEVDLPDVVAPDSSTVRVVAASVDSIIDVAVRNRPDLAASRAEGVRAAAQLQIARGASRPSLSLGATTAYTNSSAANFTGRSYALNLGLSIPIFAGFARDYAILAAAEGVETANARTESARRQVELQVFTSYTALQTATERVRTSAELLASAEASDSVALGRYTEGVGSIVDLLIAQSALADARAQSVGARWQWRTLLALLAHDAGVLGIHGESLVPLSPNPGGSR